MAVETALVRTSAELHVEASLSENELPVDKDIGHAEQLPPAVLIAACVESLEFIARIGDDIQTELLYLSAELRKSRSLTERLSAAERNAVEQGIALNLFKQ